MRTSDIIALYGVELLKKEKKDSRREKDVGIRPMYIAVFFVYD